MVAILCLIGQRNEQPEIIKKMLDVESFGDKPQYNMAAEVRPAKPFLTVQGFQHVYRDPGIV